MSNNKTTTELPVFPATAPAVFTDRAATNALFGPVFNDLAAVVAVDPNLLDGSTPCEGFTVGLLRNHALSWLQFFAAALNDPTGQTDRIDTETWQLADGQDPSGVVTEAAADISAAVEAGVADQLVVMSQARMSGDCVLAMALGEYLVHGWDLATATGRTWRATDDAAEAALAFLTVTVAPEYRGPDSGFFGHEIAAPEGATPFQRLLCFTGRDPQWTPGQG